MRQAKVLYKNQDCGMLLQHDDGSFSFTYHDFWYSDNTKPSISLTIPKTKQAYHSEFLFPFFYNMLPEGSNKQVVCQLNKIDEQDSFGILMTTAHADNIGAVSILKIN